MFFLYLGGSYTGVEASPSDFSQERALCISFSESYPQCGVTKAPQVAYPNPQMPLTIPNLGLLIVVVVVVI